MAGDANADDDVTDAKVALALLHQVPTPGFGRDVAWQRQARPEKLVSLGTTDAPGTEALPEHLWQYIRSGAQSHSGHTPFAAVDDPRSKMDRPTEVARVERSSDGATVVHTRDCMPMPDVYAPSNPTASARTLQQNGWIPDKMHRERGEVAAEQSVVELDTSAFVFERQAVRQAHGFVMKDVASGLDGDLPPKCNQLDSGRSTEMYVSGGYTVNHQALVREDLAAPPTAREQNDSAGKHSFRGASTSEDTQSVASAAERPLPQPLPPSAPLGGAREGRAPLHGAPAQAPRRRGHQAPAPAAAGAAAVPGPRQSGVPTQRGTRRERAASAPPLNATTAHSATVRGAPGAPLKHALRATPLVTGRGGGTEGVRITGDVALPRGKQYVAPPGAADRSQLAQAADTLQSATGPPLRHALAPSDRPPNVHAKVGGREHGRVRFASRRQHAGAPGVTHVATELPGVHGTPQPASHAERLHEDTGFAGPGQSAHQRPAHGAADTRGARRAVTFAVNDSGPAAAPVDAPTHRAGGLRPVQDEVEAVAADNGSRDGARDGLIGGAHTKFAQRGRAMVTSTSGRDRLAPDGKLPGVHNTINRRTADAEAVAELNAQRASQSGLLEAAPGSAARFAR